MRKKLEEDHQAMTHTQSHIYTHTLRAENCRLAVYDSLSKSNELCANILSFTSVQRRRFDLHVEAFVLIATTHPWGNFTSLVWKLSEGPTRNHRVMDQSQSRTAGVVTSCQMCMSDLGSRLQSFCFSCDKYSISNAQHRGFYRRIAR